DDARRVLGLDDDGHRRVDAAVRDEPERHRLAAGVRPDVVVRVRAGRARHDDVERVDHARRRDVGVDDEHELGELAAAAGEYDDQRADRRPLHRSSTRPGSALPRNALGPLLATTAMMITRMITAAVAPPATPQKTGSWSKSCERWWPPPSSSSPIGATGTSMTIGSARR